MTAFIAQGLGKEAAEKAAEPAMDGEIPVDFGKTDQRGETDLSATPTAFSGRGIARNSLYTFGGMLVPLLAGLLCIPALIVGMGKERFGLLGIIWMGIGYLSLFDMGLGRALTKLIAERLGLDPHSDVSDLIWTAFWLMAGCALIGAVIGMLIAEPLVVHLLNVPGDLIFEGVTSFQILALSVPVSIATATLIGILEAHRRFGDVAAIRAPLGIMTFLGPVIALQFTNSLIAATSVLLVSRFAAFVFFLLRVVRVSPALANPQKATRGNIRSLLSFGGWITVTNIVYPLFYYMDRLFVGAIMNMTAVAYYITPYDMMARTQVLPQSVLNVLFPTLTVATATQRARLTHLCSKALRSLLLLILPVTSGAFLFAPELLEFWLGHEFSVASTPVVRWLSFGWTLSAISGVPYLVLQSTGRPDITAKIQIAMIVPYVLALWFLTEQFGIEGTAAVWAFRVLLQTVVLNEIVRQTLCDLGGCSRWSYLAVIGVTVGFGLATLIEPVILRLLLFLVIAVGAGYLLWPTFRPLLFTARNVG